MTGQDAEVLVVGVGSMGAQALWQLARLGVDVLGVERFQPGHDRGSGHGETRIIRSCHQEGPAYGALIEAAWPLWRELASASGQPLLRENGLLFLGRAGDPALTADQALGQARGFPHRVLSGEHLATAYPQHRVAPNEVGFLDVQGGFLRPEQATTGAVELACRAGARLLTQTSVWAITERDGLVEVRTSAGILRARRAIVAAGAWTAAVLPQAALRIRVERRVLLWFPVPDPAPFQPQRFPCFIRHTDQTEWYGFPTLDDRTIKLAVHNGPDRRVDPDRLDREIHPDDGAALSREVERCLAGVEPVPVRGQACMYANTEDGHFVLGFAPGSERLILLGPMLGHGFKFATAVGRVGAELATEGRSSVPIDAFAPGRFA